MDLNEVINDLKEAALDAVANHCGLESLDPKLQTANEAIENATNKALKIVAEGFDLCLKEEDPDHPVQVSIPMTVHNGGKLYFSPEGYGDAGSLDGHGSPIGIEVYEGHLRIILWTDINTEDPVIVDMEGARESLRSV